jgi:hypothetical protein
MWIYDLPVWLSAVICISIFSILSLSGLLATRNYIYTHYELSHDTNDVVSYYFSAGGVFYGLLIGLIAVATWQNFTEISNIASKEASMLSVLYRDSGSFPEPLNMELQADLRTYVRCVIDESWPAQQRGVVLKNDAKLVDHFHKRLYSFQPANSGQEAIYAEALGAYNQFLEARRMRLNSVDSGLPGVLWWVMLIGTILLVVTTYFFHLSDVKLHAIMTLVMSILISLLVFLTAILDHPYRGEFSVSADPYRLVYEQLMSPSDTQSRAAGDLTSP